MTEEAVRAWLFSSHYVTGFEGSWFLFQGCTLAKFGVWETTQISDTVFSLCLTALHYPVNTNQTKLNNLTQRNQPSKQATT